MPSATENAKLWFNPLTAWKQRRDARGELDHEIDSLYRTFTGQLNRPWIRAVEEDDLKNHLGVFDYCTLGIPHLIETFCRGYWLHKIPSIQNVERAKTILAASTFLIWVPLNIVRGAFGVVSTMAVFAALIIVAPIVMLVRKIARCGRPQTEREQESQAEPVTAYVEMVNDEDPFMNPYGIPRPARPGKFWEKTKKRSEASHEVPMVPPTYQDPHPMNKVDTPSLYAEAKPVMYG